MGLIKRTAGSKKFWTKEEDELLVVMANEGKAIADIALGTGHPELSCSYRIRKLSKVESLDAISYRS